MEARFTFKLLSSLEGKCLLCSVHTSVCILCCFYRMPRKKNCPCTNLMEPCACMGLKSVITHCWSHHLVKYYIYIYKYIYIHTHTYITHNAVLICRFLFLFSFSFRRCYTWQLLFEDIASTCSFLVLLTSAVAWCKCEERERKKKGCWFLQTLFPINAVLCFAVHMWLLFSIANTRRRLLLLLLLYYYYYYYYYYCYYYQQEKRLSALNFFLCFSFPR